MTYEKRIQDNKKQVQQKTNSAKINGKIEIKCEVCGKDTYTLSEYVECSDPICSEECFNKYTKTN